ncbi:hypothetical protein HC251_10865 [Iamia sp. SCSIO 61187]|uniref:hypothetical protein n=1 Tax=Iamia sp. SCSIO 61187 TaxID=2722752 RepID=UPI001C6319AB|nr:hypothetical protein [Iamia sp. SCSIO 61187]QYG92880.1 hypothetical protein HC251_10865 [Iamia sp. SCSIO 61187]
MGDAEDRSSRTAPPDRRAPSGLPTRRLVVVAVLVALSMLAAVVLTLVLASGDDEPTEGGVGSPPVEVPEPVVGG